MRHIKYKRIIFLLIGCFQLIYCLSQQAPVGADTTININEDEALSATLPVFDPDNNLKTLVVVKSAYHGDFNLNTDGSFYYQPNAEYSGIDSVVWKATDSTDLSVSKKITIIIASVNDIPIANNLVFVSDEDIILTDNLQATDADNDILTYSLNQPAKHGSVSISQNGSFQYTPNLDFFGIDTFYWQVTDQKSDQVTAYCKITVNPVNDAPLCNNSTLFGCHIIIGKLTATDVDGGKLEYKLKSNPVGGSVQVNPFTGDFQFTAQTDWNGQTNFDFSATDVLGLSGSATVTLNTNPEYTSAENVSICAGESYILADGREVNQTGEYSSLYKTINGCDSVVQVKLTVNPAFEVNIKATICPGSKYILPDKTEVSKPDQYACILSSTKGCDSIVYISLTQAQSYNRSDKKYIKEGKAFTLPDGRIVSIGSNYTSTFKTILGCDSTIITDLTVIPQSVIHINASICEGDTYKLPLGRMVSNEGMYSDTLVSFAGGDSIIETAITIQPVFNQTEKVSVYSGLSYILPDGRHVDHVGVYISWFSTAQGCDSIWTTEVSMLSNIKYNQTANKFNIYPNPATSEIFIKRDNPLHTNLQEVNIAIQSIDGKILFSDKIKITQDVDSKIDITCLTSGVYTILIEADKFSTYYKFIKK
jgi:VCBS repeat-containing protein